MGHPTGQRNSRKVRDSTGYPDVVLSLVISAAKREVNEKGRVVEADGLSFNGLRDEHSLHSGLKYHF